MKFKCYFCKDIFDRDMRLKENKSLFSRGRFRTYCPKAKKAVWCKCLNK